jgi:glycine/D-amino acid oxidase-like deaminating enzyme
MSSRRCIVVGAGVAGSSVAWHLARRGHDVLVLERETAAATHASAQNAGMVRALVFEASIAPLAMAGARSWNRLPAELARPGSFRRTGSLLLASEASTVLRLAACVAAARQVGLEAEIWPRARCLQQVPWLDRTPFETAAWCADDGVADPVGLVDGCLSAARRHGASVRTGCEVTRVVVESGRARGVELAGGEVVSAPSVVLAPGAWAPGILRQLGLDDRGLVPWRRHLFCTVPAPGIDSTTPIVWHVDRHAYVRYESGAFLFSACDEVASAPGRPAVAPDIAAFAQERIGQVFPQLCELPIARVWAGLRTFRRQGGFVLGADGQVAGLFLAAGLGGHGVTCAGPVGARVAAAVAAASPAAAPRE